MLRGSREMVPSPSQLSSAKGATTISQDPANPKEYKHENNNHGGCFGSRWARSGILRAMCAWTHLRLARSVRWCWRAWCTTQGNLCGASTILEQMTLRLARRWTFRAPTAMAYTLPVTRPANRFPWTPILTVIFSWDGTNPRPKRLQEGTSGGP